MIFRRRFPVRLCRVWSGTARWLLAAFLCLVTGLAAAAVSLLPGGGLPGQPVFLPVDEAFRFSAALHSGAAGGSRSDEAPVATDDHGDWRVIEARWSMPPGYYLYRHAFAAQLRPAPAASGGELESAVRLGELEIPAGLAKQDDYFGAVEVYYGSASLRVPVLPGAETVEVGITYQGCADRGLCYPPETRWVTVPGTAMAGVERLSGAAPEQVQAGAAAAADVTEDRRLASLLADGGLLTALLLFFLGGVGLAFTPCVLPMVPILSSIIVGQQGIVTRGHAVRLSLAYVFGMALAYAAVGTVVGLFGAGLNLQASLQAPVALILFAGLFVALACSMFGFYELQLPARWQDALNALGDRVAGGRHAGVFVMGAVSALVVSPCVSAPLAGALIYLSATGDALLGGTALLALGLGMGVPLLVIGASGAHLLPRTGPWMNAVKSAFGVGLLGVAVWLVERIIPPAAALALWGGLAVGVGVYLGALEFAPRQGWAQFWKALGVCGLLYGAMLLVGAASGAEDPLRPLGRLAAGGERAEAEGGELDWRPVQGLAGAREALAAAVADGRPAVLDLYADWCISCKVMERSVFPAPAVADRLRGFRLLRADVTANGPDDQALLAEFGLFGPPSLLFFGADGSEIVAARIQGEIDAPDLAAHLGRLSGSVPEPAGTGAIARDN